MGIRFLSVAAGAALALAACGGSQEVGQVPADSPLTQHEDPESMPGDDDDDDWFADDAFDDLDDLDDPAEPAEPDEDGEDDAEPAASNSSASEDADGDAAETAGEAGEARAADDPGAGSTSGS